MRCGLVLLAAGASQRMGQPKQLLEYQGKPLLRRAVDTALAARVDRVIVVLGANAEPVAAALANAAIDIVHNARWEEGMGTSIHAGVQRASDLQLDAVILALGDQPLITAEIYNRLIAEHESSSKPIVTSEYAGTVGVPVLFAKEYFPQLFGLAPDQGCKGVIVKNGASVLRIACPEAEVDIDTPSDFQKLHS
jgi:molybdenum cofactor cytidylyltransferase